MAGRGGRNHQTITSEYAFPSGGPSTVRSQKRLSSFVRVKPKNFMAKAYEVLGVSESDGAEAKDTDSQSLQPRFRFFFRTVAFVCPSL